MFTVYVFIVIQGINCVLSGVINWTFMAPRFYKRSFMEPRDKKQTKQPVNKINYNWLQPPKTPHNKARKKKRQDQTIRYHKLSTANLVNQRIWQELAILCHFSISSRLLTTLCLFVAFLWLHFYVCFLCFACWLCFFWIESDWDRCINIQYVWSWIELLSGASGPSIISSGPDPSVISVSFLYFCASSMWWLWWLVTW